MCLSGREYSDGIVTVVYERHSCMYIEGSYLLPDHLNGYGYLQAVRDVLDGKYE